MKKILLLMVLTGSMALAGEACLKDDFASLLINVSVARKLKDSKSTMDKLKYTGQVANIVKSVQHLIETHLLVMTLEQKEEVNSIKNEFTS